MMMKKDWHKKKRKRTEKKFKGSCRNWKRDKEWIKSDGSRRNQHVNSSGVKREPLWPRIYRQNAQKLNLWPWVVKHVLPYTPLKRRRSILPSPTLSSHSSIFFFSLFVNLQMLRWGLSFRFKCWVSIADGTSTFYKFKWCNPLIIRFYSTIHVSLTRIFESLELRPLIFWLWFCPPMTSN